VEAPLASVVAGARICHVAARLHGGIALRVGRALISFSLDSLAPTHPRDPRLPSEQPKKELMLCLMLARKFARTPTPRPADSPACPCSSAEKHCDCYAGCLYTTCMPIRDPADPDALYRLPAQR
jgi:hypothetical protein